jgi:hypothetical protein
LEFHISFDLVLEILRARGVCVFKESVDQAEEDGIKEDKVHQEVACLTEEEGEYDSSMDEDYEGSMQECYWCEPDSAISVSKEVSRTGLAEESNKKWNEF